MSVDLEQLAQEFVLFHWLDWLDSDCMADHAVDSIFVDPGFYGEDFLDEISSLRDSEDFEDFE
jgi:hypothetical protein